MGFPYPDVFCTFHTVDESVFQILFHPYLRPLWSSCIHNILWQSVPYVWHLLYKESPPFVSVYLATPVFIWWTPILVLEDLVSSQSVSLSSHHLSFYRFLSYFYLSSIFQAEESYPILLFFIYRRYSFISSSSWHSLNFFQYVYVNFKMRWQWYSRCGWTMDL